LKIIYDLIIFKKNQGLYPLFEQSFIEETSVIVKREKKKLDDMYKFFRSNLRRAQSQFRFVRHKRASNIS
jgi:hypothetical protein